MPSHVKPFQETAPRGKEVRKRFENSFLSNATPCKAISKNGSARQEGTGKIRKTLLVKYPPCKTISKNGFARQEGTQKIRKTLLVKCPPPCRAMSKTGLARQESTAARPFEKLLCEARSYAKDSQVPTCQMPPHVKPFQKTALRVVIIVIVLLGVIIVVFACRHHHYRRRHPH